MDGMADFESVGRGSIPRRGTQSQHVLGVCRIRTRPCEGRGSGSIPGEDTFGLSISETVTMRHDDHTLDTRAGAAGGIGAVLMALLGGVARHADDVGRGLLHGVDDIGRGAVHQVDDLGRIGVGAGDDIFRGARRHDQYRRRRATNHDRYRRHVVPRHQAAPSRQHQCRLLR